MKSWFKQLPEVDSMTKVWSGGPWSVPETDGGRNKVMLAVIDTVAANLGNTRAVCRSSYIHPWFLDAWMEERLDTFWSDVASMRSLAGMSPGESATLRILKSLRDNPGM
jgi:DNA topoisomerase-1